MAAAGNDGSDNDSTASYPANYNLSNVISGASTNNKDGLAGFSNFGSKSVDLAAPGVDIASTYTEDRYAYMSGTSMAAPHVTGVAALVKSQNPALDDAQIRTRILDSVDKKDNLRGKMVTGGRLNAAAALSAQASSSPTASITSTQLGVSASRSVVGYGTGISLSGRLVTSSGRGVPGKQLILEQLPVDARRYSSVGSAATASDGRYVLRGVRPTKNVQYRARFTGGTNDFKASTSSARGVKVRPGLSLRTSTRKLKLNRSRTIRGHVAPYHRGKVQVQIRRNGKLISRKKVGLSRSKYAFTYRPPRPGVYSFKAVYPKHRDHLQAVSPNRKFRVVR